MKSIKFFVAALVLVAAVPMFGQTATDNLLVSADVVAVCTVTTTPVAFGTYDPTAAAATTASGFVNVTCTRGASGLTIDLGAGANAGNASATTRAMSDGGTEYLDYDLFTTGAYATVWTTGVAIPNSTSSTVAQNIEVFGRMPALQNAAVGTYGDTVLATLNY